MSDPVNGVDGPPPVPGPSSISINATKHVPLSASKEDAVNHSASVEDKGNGENGVVDLGITAPTVNDSQNDDGQPGVRNVAELEAELEQVKHERDHMSNQYRSLLSKLTAMRKSLGDKLKEDAEELDRREVTINQLTSDLMTSNETINALRSALQSSNEEAAGLQSQLAQLRSQSDSSSSDILSLTREMRELRGEMERLRVEREEWEDEAGRERAKREAAEDEARLAERKEREARMMADRARDEALAERERAENLQDVLGEFQAAKDSELRLATSDLESQLKMAVSQLSEAKLRAANAETQLGDLVRDASRTAHLEKEIQEKNQVISKLRHDAVVNNEHLTEALRRLRKNSSDNNVDRRLVTNILLSFLSTSRADSKRFEMLSLLSTILSWDDSERERAGLQRSGVGKGGGGSNSSSGRPGAPKRKSSATTVNERTVEEEAAMNESFSNLFVEFLLKEASQGQKATAPNPSSLFSPSDHPGSPVRSPPSSQSISSIYSPPRTGTHTPFMSSSAPPPGVGTGTHSSTVPRPRGMSSSSSTSASGGSGIGALGLKPGATILQEAMEIRSGTSTPVDR